MEPWEEELAREVFGPVPEVTTRPSRRLHIVEERRESTTETEIVETPSEKRTVEQTHEQETREDRDPDQDEDQE